MEKLEITLKSQGNISADCTTAYDVRLSRPCTVGEFIRTVLATFPNEWGTFRIYCMGVCEYRAGEVLKCDFSYDTLEREIYSISASGGWSRMDYLITLKV